MSEQVTSISTTQQKPKSLIREMAAKYKVDPEKLMSTLKATAFKQRGNDAVTNEQMMSLMVVADQYGLNPFTKEIFAFPDKQNGIVPVVGLDGWSRIMNEHPQFNGIDFISSRTIEEIDKDHKPCPEWIEAIIYRKDRDHPIKVKEYLDEVYRPAFKPRGKDYTIDGPWQSHTKRMLRHKAMIQCARIAFGFAGIYDQDEAERIIDMGTADVVMESSGKNTKADSLNEAFGMNEIDISNEDEEFPLTPEEVAESEDQ